MNLGEDKRYEERRPHEHTSRKLLYNRSYDPAIPLLWIDSREVNSPYEKVTCSPIVIAVQSVKDIETNQMPIKRQMDKEIIELFHEMLLGH